MENERGGQYSYSESGKTDSGEMLDLTSIKSSESLRFPIHDVRGISDVNEVVGNLKEGFELEGGIYNFGSPNEKNTYETMLEVFRTL